MQKIPARKKLLFFITLITTSFVASAQNGWSAEIEMEGSEGTTLTGKVMTTFDQPWAMTFLPDGHSLVTEKKVSSGCSTKISKNGFQLITCPV